VVENGIEHYLDLGGRN